MKGAALAALLASWLVSPSAVEAQIDLRLTWGDGVLARRGEQVGGGGDAVRFVWGDGAVCNGTLAPIAEASIEVAGARETALLARARTCIPTHPSRALFAIVRPPPMSRWPRGVDATSAPEAVVAARAAATVAGHLRGEITWSAPRVVAIADATYALVSGGACADATPCAPTVAAVARVRARGAPEVVIVRPAHRVWSSEELASSTFAWEGLVDVDGDGVIELVETQIGDGAYMVRLIRASARPEGDVVWTASYRDDPVGASVDHTPRPVTHH